MKLKRLLPLIFLLILVLVLPGRADAATVTASGTCGTDLVWHMDENGLLQISGSGAMTNYKTDSTENDAWAEAKKVVFLPGVTSIGSYAFYNCTKLESVVFNEDIREIGLYAFCGCSGLTTISLPDSVTTLNNACFKDCSNLEYVYLNDTLENIGMACFTDCTALEWLDLPATVEIIGRKAFSSCSGLKKVIFRGDHPTLGSDTFSGVEARVYYYEDNTTWTNAVGNNYGGTLTWVPLICETSAKDSGQCGENLFWRSDADGRLQIFGTGPMYDYFQGGYAHPNWAKIIEVDILPGATDIGNNAFKGCSDMEKVWIPSTVTAIGRSAFNGTELKACEIPDSVTSIGPWAFASTYIETVTIPDSVTQLGDHLFAYNTNTTGATFPSDMTTLPEYCFYACWNITSFEVPEGVTVIGAGAFSRSHLTSVTLPSTLEEIGKEAFYECKLTQITIPETVTTIGNEAFSNCESLEAIAFPASVTTYGTGIVSGCSDLKQVTLPQNMTAIPDGMFQYCSGLEQIIIPDSVTDIGEDAFYSCSALTSLRFPEGVTELKLGVISGCDKLTEFRIPSKVTTIGTYAFEDCTGLKALEIPTSVHTIGNCAFAQSGLTKLYIPDTVTTLGNALFAECVDLTEARLPEGVADWSYMFIGCTSLESYTVPASATKLDETFSGCTSLKQLRFLGDFPAVDTEEFTGVTATVWYPYGNETWTDSVLQNYGGTITWKPYLYNVTVNKVTPHTTGNILYWDAVPGGDIYQIYRLNGSSWELLKNTRSLAYKDETAKVGVKHYYKIVARNGDLKSDIATTASVSAVRPAAGLPNVTVNKTIGHVTGNILYWDAVAGGDIYQVYRLNGSSWELLKNTRSLAYKDETAKVGVKHYYKIVARNGDLKSDIATTASASVTRPAPATLDNVTIYKTVGHTTGNILYWNAVPGAQLYQVYRLDNGSWKLLKNTGSLAYKDETAPVGVKCYYKIVARSGDVKSNIATTASASATRP